jgi:thioredoxin-like negative regulator of GroEL
MKLLIFTGPNCPGCKGAPALIEELAGQVDYEKVNVMDDAGEALANRYDVRALPTVVLVADNGAKLSAWPGRLPFALEIMEEVEARA